MRCRRCHGTMVVDGFIEMKDGAGDLWLRAWRCGNCGGTGDPVIAHRRPARRSRFSRVLAGLSRPFPRDREIVPLGI